jgi:hypothetical protein
VVPLGQDFVRSDAEELKLFRSGFCSSWIVAGPVERRPISLGLGRANEAEDFPITVERFAGPVLRSLREELVLDGIPRGSAGQVVIHGEGQTEGVGQLRMKFNFPGPGTIAVAAAGVA